MIDLGISKMALIGAVALVVIGPEKLPRVARTVGALLGKAQRYVSDVKAEVNRSMELDALKQMKTEVENAAQNVNQSIQDGARDLEHQLSSENPPDVTAVERAPDPVSPYSYPSVLAPPEYKRPQKNWRVRQGAMPQWYKARAGVRTKAQSGAARVARFRPQKPS